MAFSATFSQNSFSCLSKLPHNLTRNLPRFSSIRAVKDTEPEKEKTAQTKSEESSVSNAQPSTTAPKTLRKPVYSSEFWIFKKKCFYLKKKKIKGHACYSYSLLFFLFLIWGSEERSDCEGGQGEVS